MATIERPVTYAAPGSPDSPVEVKSRYENFIGGGWRAPVMGGYKANLSPVTGKPLAEPLRLEGINDFIFSSPVGAAGRIYVTGRDGSTVVLRHDRENATLAVNHLDDSFTASAALVGKEMYLRGERFLYCIAEKQ